ncbi:hypothetical protein EVAR_57690_1 [Eumeta japonica]|uniref:Uncharacterized protein n=1 Tax=Eumeta variegata TaxID=151549 RepID=A0A4C1Y5Z3_EUMVA|nr:hypothetical protein EVAR_57690_1 [Eumeta japonica]
MSRVTNIDGLHVVTDKAPIIFKHGRDAGAGATYRKLSSTSTAKVLQVALSDMTRVIRNTENRGINVKTAHLLLQCYNESVGGDAARRLPNSSPTTRAVRPAHS